VPETALPAGLVNVPARHFRVEEEDFAGLDSGAGAALSCGRGSAFCARRAFRLRAARWNVCFLFAMVEAPFVVVVAADLETGRHQYRNASARAPRHAEPHRIPLLVARDEFDPRVPLMERS
jgi:hypothetical protein